MAGSAVKVLPSGYSSYSEYIERLIDERAGVEMVNGKAAPSIVDELTGFLSVDDNFDADDEKEKALREKYGLAY
ncbi:MAG: hypothetical protein II954_12270 [Synergistaceae bacterium]|nr:hypothetical protein [Synergistaceae bacterium]